MRVGIRVHAKGTDTYHREAHSSIFLVIQFDHAVDGTRPGQPFLYSMAGVDMTSGVAWTWAVLVKAKEDPYHVGSILSWMSELGHSKVVVQSHGKLAPEVVIHKVQSRGTQMENPSIV